MCIFVQTEGSHTVEVYSVSGTIKQLDEKFIPDSIKNSISNKLDRETYNEKIV